LVLADGDEVAVTMLGDAIPYGIAWPGLVANTVIFGAVLSFLTYLVVRLRRTAQ
jgi:predicted small integral membrane protein